jgi:ABC-type protease/lipase transport system fused ATPase/permease subunit
LRGNRLSDPIYQGASPTSELAAALDGCKSAFVGVALFSALINLLVLTGPIFMLQIYDRAAAVWASQGRVLFKGQSHRTRLCAE